MRLMVVGDPVLLTIVCSLLYAAKTGYSQKLFGQDDGC